MQTTASAAAAGVPQQRLEFTYDHQSRRVRKVVKSFNPANQTFEVTKDTRFLYDGWNMIAELEASPSLPLSASPRLAATHAWGLDLSGTETGAGGVGGLVFTALYSTTQTTANNSQAPPASVLAPCYDGNGNILAYVDCATGQPLARYEYDPFGKLLLQEENPRVAGRLHHQFSTKYFDAETGLSYYGYRYYCAEWGRWVSRDPIGEDGGNNLFHFAANDPANLIDHLGLEPWSVYALWGRAVAQFFALCDQERRCDGGHLNNIGAFFGVGSLCGCVDQTGILLDTLESISPSLPPEYLLLPQQANYPLGAQHHWLDGVPFRSTDPTISMDMHAGEIKITHPNGTIEETTLRCKPRSMRTRFILPDGSVDPPPPAPGTLAPPFKPPRI